MADKAPYVLTLFWAALGWTVNHFVDRVIEAPTIEYQISQTSAKGQPPGTHDYIVRVTNLSSDRTFHSPAFTVQTDPSDTSAQIRIENKPGYPTVRGVPPASASGASANAAPQTGATFTIPVFPPGAQFDLVTRYKGTGKLVFTGQPTATVAGESFALVPSSLETEIARHEFAILSGGLGLWLLIILARVWLR